MTTDPILNAMGQTVATVRQIRPGFFEVERQSHRGDYVNLGVTFSHMDISEIRQWARNFTEAPKWSDWKKLTPYRRASRT